MDQFTLCYADLHRVAAYTDRHGRKAAKRMVAEMDRICRDAVSRTAGGDDSAPRFELVTHHESDSPFMRVSVRLAADTPGLDGFADRCRDRLRRRREVLPEHWLRFAVDRNRSDPTR